MSSKVLHQGPCYVCGSSDAYTEYSDGGAHCFSCGYHVHPKISGYVRKREVERDEVEIKLPDDISNEYSPECLKWVDQYGLKAVDLMRHKVKWSQRYNQLIFVYQHMEKPTIGCVQARNFTDGRTKYYNQGDVNQVLPIYYYTKPLEASRLVIVEDAISAIKVSQNVWVDAMPLLGSHLPLHKITRIRNAAYSECIVWLDHDKYKEAMNIAEKIRFTGIKVKVVTSDLDPKCYSTEEIARKIGLLA